MNVERKVLARNMANTYIRTHDVAFHSSRVPFFPPRDCHTCQFALELPQLFAYDNKQTDTENVCRPFKANGGLVACFNSVAADSYNHP